MLDRYKKVREFLPDIGIPEVVKMAEGMSADLINRAVDRLHALLSDLDSVTKSLQRDNITMSQVRRCLMQLLTSTHQLRNICKLMRQ